MSHALTDAQKMLIRDTWARVLPMADAAMSVFYDRLFEIDPGLKPLFKNSDMAAQRSKLAQALGTVIASLDDLGRVLPVLEDLGRRHAAYGVEDRHYATVGLALLDTLEKGLGDAWSAEAATAWRGAYGLVSGVMQAAAAAVPVRARTA